MNFAFLTAQQPASGGFSQYAGIIMIAVMGLALYFLMYRPQKKREKEQVSLRNSIEIGDEVVTIGGIVGRVVSVKQDTFVLETAGDRSRIRFKRDAIQHVGKLDMDSEASQGSSSTAAAKDSISGKKEKKEKKSKDKDKNAF